MAEVKPSIIHPYSPLDLLQPCFQWCRHYQVPTAQIDHSSWLKSPTRKVLPYPEFTFNLNQIWPRVGYQY